MGTRTIYICLYIYMTFIDMHAHTHTHMNALAEDALMLRHMHISHPGVDRI